jgi:hypothetical protein
MRVARRKEERPATQPVLLKLLKGSYETDARPAPPSLDRRSAWVGPEGLRVAEMTSANEVRIEGDGSLSAARSWGIGRPGHAE